VIDWLINSRQQMVLASRIVRSKFSREPKSKFAAPLFGIQSTHVEDH
jgi:hypothetical protein